ncbi:hypothetical protein SAMN02745945_01752 [Peptoclostridium litorale DSM 5388]|uniref:Nucleotide modification associated domain-containing protein n=1 Tax=Peptoclostridium litorale DSM 5388 TaxID=1121324 RepID=A0A069RIJ4_PEPLI|nr:hypothetical protein [Peptoclostridium litorale]KDR95975.1 hypothetical protein CLIT_8c01440 [Peptoclostridium litorale DSM 5388]SIO08859.1 hypothetical protein SAMN02745945_01752 [Peptoclostridium litorale DSM 5388]
MKIILSRKGFDSAFPNGKLLSLPIPDENAGITYGQLRIGEKSYLDVVENLFNKHIKIEGKIMKNF